MSNRPEPNSSRLRNELITCGIILIGIPLLLLIIIGAVFMWALSTSHIEREIAGPTVINSEWLEITPGQPLKPSNREQSLLLKVTEAYTPDRQNMGMKFPDDSIARPEVQLVDINGNIYPMDRSSFISNDPAAQDGLGGMRFYREYLPQNGVYRVVRIRSNRSFRCEGIMWVDVARK